LADWCEQHGYSSKFFPNAAFIVFCVHYPVVVMLRKACISHFALTSDTVHIVLYFACVVISTLMSICFYILLDKYLPNVKNILSGNR
jgi:peptidoglycan/LPS O-acetylase OafA/YrhL